MTLRCRKGDMAFVVKSFSGREGWMVDVVEYVGTGMTSEGIFPNLWRTSHKNDGLTSYFSDDSHLLPIRPGDLDESEETEKTLEFTE